MFHISRKPVNQVITRESTTVINLPPTPTLDDQQKRYYPPSPHLKNTVANLLKSPVVNLGGLICSHKRSNILSSSLLPASLPPDGLLAVVVEGTWRGRKRLLMDDKAAFKSPSQEGQGVCMQ